MKERGQYGKAKLIYQQYLEMHPDDVEINKEVENVTQFANETLKDMICDLELSPLNSVYSDFSPVYYKGKLIFQLRSSK